jgi:hypothetical protein
MILGSKELVSRSVFLLLVLMATIASCAASLAQDNQPVPRFEDYRVKERYEGKTAQPLLATRGDRQFRTMLREAAREKPNFAGHYVLTAWGCGAECLMGAALDAKTGKVFWIPFTICCWPDDVKSGMDFRLDSSLIVFTGSRNEKGGGVYYYKFEKDRFTLVRAIEKPGSN